MMSKVRLVALGAAVATLLAARRAAYAGPRPDVTARAEAAQHSGPWRHGHAEVNGVRLHYAEMGTGPLVILLHGFPECWYTWSHVMPRLAERFHVVAPDMRGYNLSDKPKGVAAYSVDTLARDVVALVETLGERRAHVVGHDWGGVVAWRLGMYHAEHVDRLVAINAPHPAAFERELKRPEQMLRSSYAFFFQLPLLPEAVVRLVLRRSLPASAAVPGAFSDEALDVYENSMAQPGAATAMINYYRSAGRESFKLLNQDKPLIDRPTMLIWGMKDFALSPRLTEGLEPWVPNLLIERVEESGHWVPEEKPRLVADKLLDFLDG